MFISSRILVHGGCTPVGCVLVQLLSQWKASVTVTCYRRALPVVHALGAADAIVIPEDFTPSDKFDSEINVQEQNEVILKELENRGDSFDVIIQTERYFELTNKELSQFLKIDGTIFSTLPPEIESDSNGTFSNFLLWLYVNLRYKLQVKKYRSCKINFDLHPFFLIFRAY